MAGSASMLQRSSENLFNIVPEGLFSPLARRYRAVYAYALVTLYRCLKLNGSHILRHDYMEMLRSHGDDIASLFSISSDRSDDREDDISVEMNEDSDKWAYIVRKLSASGWFQVIKDFRSKEELIFLPPYSIMLLEVLNNMVAMDRSYLPLVHQTYAELSMEDENEDEFMYRSLANAVHNSEQLELSVTLLHHSIVVYNNKLVDVTNPNEALRQHFDDFRTKVSNPIYHPMKTYDSFGLYSRPIVKILTGWLRDERKVSRLASQMRVDPTHIGMTIEEARDQVVANLNRIIDIFNRLNFSFDEIDRANSDYTEAVQRKVNYLSGSDKSFQGKLERIVAALVEELKKHPNANEENNTILARALDSVNPVRMGILKPSSLYMPFHREIRIDEEPLGIAEDMAYSDENLMEDFLASEVSEYSEEKIESFMRRAFGSKDEITSLDIKVRTTEDLILLILAIVRSEFDICFFTADRLKESVVNGVYRMPLYRFVRKDRVQ